jgi:hypothetical protein
VELAERCLLEARRTLDGKASEQLRIMARRYLQEAERLDEVSASHRENLWERSQDFHTPSRALALGSCTPADGRREGHRKS